MNIKNWIINPCNKCLVFACCNQACNKLRSFMQKQSNIYLIIGFIIWTPILISFIYKFCLIYSTVLILFTISWLAFGVYFYIEILKIASDINNNIFIIILSFIWLPYVVFSVFIGMMLGLTFIKKNAQF